VNLPVLMVDYPQPKPEGRAVAAHCQHCKRAIAAHVRGSYFGFRKEEDDDPGVGAQEFVLLECPLCCNPLLAKLSWFDLRWEQTDEWQVVKEQVLYPSAPRLSDGPPDHISKIFDEAIDCMEIHAHRACTLMCRGVLEAICSHMGEKKGTLERKLENLRDKELIDAKLFEWATELRFVGNVAAHELEVAPSKQEAQYALTFTRAVAEQVFTLAVEFKRFQKSRTVKSVK
jgi:hypothetical protein